MKIIKTLGYFIMSLFLLVACKEANSTDVNAKTDTEFKVEYEKFTLDNGLQVIFHIDRSDPVVAVALTSHVGSARELEGRTGFAHLFEHLLFLESENLGKGGLDKMSARIGGSGANGSTSRDRTNYFQTVPKDALEKMIWAEADKLGYFINTVTDPVLAKEKEVVKNEKRQGVDNRPHGHVNYVMNKHMYPAGHPYSWTVIGSLEDLQNATLDDVKNFYKRWYVPNNVTLTIAGDFNTNEAKNWVKKYFDEIERGEEIVKNKKLPITLTASKNLYYEDNFARLPRLTMAWPSVYQYHEDAYALDVLTTYLTQGKKAPLYKSLVVDNQLTDNVNLYNSTSELAGELVLSVSTFAEHDLNEAKEALEQGLLTFEKDGIGEADLKRIKAGQETDFYRSLSSVLGKGFQLAQYEIFAGDPGYINEDIQKILAVTRDDVMRVYQKYMKDKPFVAISSVPQGKKNLALADGLLAEVVEEKIIDGAEKNFDASIAATYEKTPSSFDRSIEPPYGESPKVKIPEVWKNELDNGMKLYGIENNEVPLVQFRLQLKGGMLLEDSNKIGVSNLLAGLMIKGTKDKTTEELENAIENLGANISINASPEAIVISGNCLSKNYEETLALVKEILLNPRWDANEFDLIKQSTLNRLLREEASPNSIASNQFDKLVYGSTNILSNNNLGTTESVNAIELADLKNYYSANFSPHIANYHVVGDISKDKVETSVLDLVDSWKPKEIEFPEIQMPNRPNKSKVYFYDVPGAKQSVIRFGAPGVAATDKNYYPLSVMNYRLGGGGFASQLTQQLREGKGYTYGIGSGFSGSNSTGVFEIGSGIRSNATLDAAKLVKKILQDYSKNYNEDDLAITKGFMIKSNARAFETLGSKLGMLSNISNYNYADDYAAERTAIVENMSIEDVKALANKYINADQMIYLIVGDAESQFKKLNQLGFGEPELLNPPSKLKD